MDIDIAGAALTAEYELSMHFALDDCQGGGIDGGTCTPIMSGFDMTLHDIAMSGGDVDYQVTAGLSLSQTAVAEVFFDECGVSTCEGGFELSVAEENSIGVNLEWTQVNPTNMSTGHGELYLANDGVALGGLDPLYGFIQPSSSTTAACVRSGALDIRRGGHDDGAVQRAVVLHGR